MQFVREADPQLGPHADLFRKHVGASACPLWPVLEVQTPGTCEHVGCGFRVS